MVWRLLRKKEHMETQHYTIQKTIKKPLSFEGVGLHSGKDCRITLYPTDPNTGIQFLRSDLYLSPLVPAEAESVCDTMLATTVGKGKATVQTIEHLMAALYALGLTNILVECSGPEIPILDGSAFPFVEAIEKGGYQLQPFTMPLIKIKKPIQVFEREGVCELLPRENLRVTASIDFPHPLIQIQTFSMDLTPENFIREVSLARTFGFFSDLKKLQERNLALGASLENALGFNEAGLMNPEGFRIPEECVRHKLLDAIGDLALSGAYFQGEFVSYRGGHALHRSLLLALKANREAWEYVPGEAIRNVLNFSKNPILESPISIN